MAGNLIGRCCLFLTVVVAGASTARAEVVRTGYSVIVAASSGKCVDISGASNTPGAAAVQWHCNFGSNEQWTLQPDGGGYRIVEQKNGQCLASAGGSTAPEAAIVQTTCTGAATERWQLVPAAGGVQLVNQGSALCANVSGNSAADRAAIVQSSCSTASNFVWSFGGGLVGPAAAVVAQADHSGQCLNVTGASKASGAAVIQWPCTGDANDQWKLVPAGAGYQVVSGNSGLCAAVSGSSTSDGATVVQVACSLAPNLIWTLKAAGGAYQLVAQHSGQCLTVSGGSLATGTPVVQGACASGALNQLWSLSAPAIPSSWTAAQSLAVNPIAVANLPSGKLLMWSAYDQYNFQGDTGTANGQTRTAVFDPATGASSAVVVTNTGDDMFCPGTANLPDGRILVNGGTSSPKTSLYDPASGTWSSSGAMNIRRGYEGDTLISTGAVFTLGGSWSGGQGNKDGELWTNGVWSRLTGVTAAPVTGPDPQGVYRGDNHLWLFATSGGQVFHAGPSAAMHWITTTGSGTITSPGNRGDDGYAINGDAVLYDAGTIVKAGGAPAYQNATASAAAYVIKFTGGVSVTKVAPMAYPRAFATGVALPNGQVVIVGGQTTPVPFSDNTAILVPEIWDPVTRVFRKLNAMRTPRVYHSTAILLPDGRVFVGGGGQCGQGCTANHFDTEILTPPYLLNPDGSPALRPTIASAPPTGRPGGSLSVTTGAPVTSFVLMRLSSVTHTVNNDQRRIPLAIQSTTGTTSYSLTIPADPGVVLPGYYMLFALNAQGVPSLAATVRIG